MASETGDAAASARAGAGATLVGERIGEKIVAKPFRQKRPRSREGRSFEFRVADCKGFANIGEYEDGRPGSLSLPCPLYTFPSPRDRTTSRMPSSA